MDSSWVSSVMESFKVYGGNMPQFIGTCVRLDHCDNTARVEAVLSTVDHAEDVADWINECIAGDREEHGFAYEIINTANTKIKAVKPEDIFHYARFTCKGPDCDFIYQVFGV